MYSLGEAASVWGEHHGLESVVVRGGRGLELSRIKLDERLIAEFRRFESPITRLLHDHYIDLPLVITRIRM